VLGVLPGIVGTIQATEAIKIILGIGDTLAGRLLLVDAKAMSFRTIRLRRDPSCAACGTREIQSLTDYDELCAPHVTAPGQLAGSVQEITPRDVREPYEWRIARIDGARLIPLGQFANAAREMPPDRDVVLYCHHGLRSRTAAEHLVERGFRRVWNLTGGIDRWSADVDPTVATY
jgi:adenylyltransferase/sulfurtransferase